MASAHYKAGLGLAFALVFSAVQILCGCMADTSLQNTHSVQAQSNAMSHCEMNNATPDFEAQIKENTDSSDQNQSCFHCDTFVMLSAPGDVVLTALVHHKIAPKLTISSTLVSPPHFSVATKTFTTLRWRDPPRALLRISPIQLKTRSLT